MWTYEDRENRGLRPLAASGAFNQGLEMNGHAWLADMTGLPDLEIGAPVALDEIALAKNLLGRAVTDHSGIIEGISRVDCMGVTRDLARAKGLLIVDSQLKMDRMPRVLTRDMTIFIGSDKEGPGTILFKPQDMQEQEQMIKVALGAGKVEVCSAASASIMGYDRQNDGPHPLSVAEMHSLTLPLKPETELNWREDYLQAQNGRRVCGGIDYARDGGLFVDMELGPNELALLSGEFPQGTYWRLSDALTSMLARRGGKGDLLATELLAQAQNFLMA